MQLAGPLMSTGVRHWETFVTHLVFVVNSDGGWSIVDEEVVGSSIGKWICSIALEAVLISLYRFHMNRLSDII